MLANNTKTFIYHALWYFVVAGVFFIEKSRTILAQFIPDETLRLLVMGGATIIFSLIFTILFMEPMDSFGKNVGSNVTLILLDVGVITLSAIMYLFKRLSLYQTIMTGLFIILQLLIVFIVMKLKGNKEETY
ncbi:hypothetical protein [Guggenheimella bovis]